MTRGSDTVARKESCRRELTSFSTCCALLCPTCHGDQVRLDSLRQVSTPPIRKPTDQPRVWRRPEASRAPPPSETKDFGNTTTTVLTRNEGRADFKTSAPAGVRERRQHVPGDRGSRGGRRNDSAGRDRRITATVRGCRGSAAAAAAARGILGSATLPRTLRSNVDDHVDLLLTLDKNMLSFFLCHLISIKNR